MSSAPLAPDTLATLMVDLPGWTHEHDALCKTFNFKDFREAIAFMVRVGFEAEALNHHPEWTNIYDQVSVQLSTHSAGHRVTEKDIELARVMERVKGA